GSFEVAALFVGQAGVGEAGNARVGRFAERADVVGHEFRAGGAVEPNGEQAGMGHGNPEGVGGLPGEHGAGGLDGAGDHEGNVAGEFAAGTLDAEQRGLDVAGVLAGLDEEYVCAAFDEPQGLHVKGLLQLFKGDVAGDADGAGGGAHRASDETGPAGLGGFVGGLAGELGGAAVQLARVGGEAVFAEDERRAAECVGFDDVRAGFEIGAMDAEDHVRARADEDFVAAFELRAAEVGRGKILLLDHGAHGAVQNQDARIERVFERLPAMVGVTHGGNCNASMRARGVRMVRRLNFAGRSSGVSGSVCLEGKPRYRKFAKAGCRADAAGCFTQSLLRRAYSTANSASR